MSQLCCICTQIEVHIDNSLLIVCSIVQLRYSFGLLFILCNSVETVCMQLLAGQGLGHPLERNDKQRSHGPTLECVISVKTALKEAAVIISYEMGFCKS
jgi:hypothetical protein